MTKNDFVRILGQGLDSKECKRQLTLTKKLSIM